MRLHPLKLVYSILVLIANERAAHKPYTAKGHWISWLEEKLFHSLKSSNKLMSTVSLYAARGWYTSTIAAAVQHPSSVGAAQELWVSCTGAECKRHARGAGAEWELHESCAWEKWEQHQLCVRMRAWRRTPISRRWYSRIYSVFPCPCTWFSSCWCPWFFPCRFNVHSHYWCTWFCGFYVLGFVLVK